MTHTLDTILGQVALSLSILGFALAGIIPVGISANRQYMEGRSTFTHTQQQIIDYSIPIGIGFCTLGVGGGVASHYLEKRRKAQSSS